MYKIILTLLTSLCLNGAFALEIIHGSSVGSQSDSIARLFATQLEKDFTQGVTVNSIPGASGVNAIKTAKEYNVANDMILVAYSNLITVKYLNPELKIHWMDDFEPVGGGGIGVMSVYTNSKLNITDLKDLNHYNKDHVIKIGTSSFTDMTIFVQLAKQMNLKYTEVKYKQQSDLYRDLANGVIDINVGSYGKASAQAYVDSGQIVPIVTLGDIKHPQYTNVKTLKEQGYKNIEPFSWTSFFVRKDASPYFKEKVKASIIKTFSSEEARSYENKPGKPLVWRSNAKEVYDQLIAEDKILPELINATK